MCSNSFLCPLQRGGGWGRVFGFHYKSYNPPCGKSSCWTQTSQTVLCEWEQSCEGLSAGHRVLKASCLFVCLFVFIKRTGATEVCLLQSTLNLWVCFSSLSPCETRSQNSVILYDTFHVAECSVMFWRAVTQAKRCGNFYNSLQSA